MLNLLRRLKYEAFDKHPKRTVDIEADLTSPLSPQASGEVEFKAYDDNSWYLDVELSHRHHAFNDPFDLRLNGASVLSLEPGKDETKFKSQSQNGVAMPASPKLGDRLEVVHNGKTVFQGIFERD